MYLVLLGFLFLFVGFLNFFWYVLSAAEVFSEVLCQCAVGCLVKVSGCVAIINTT